MTLILIPWNIMTPSAPKHTSFLAISDFNKPPIDVRLLTIMAVHIINPKTLYHFLQVQ